jgi:hypothetical protein
VRDLPQTLLETAIMFAIRPLRALATLVAVFGFAPAALAGPPLICHPFVTDAAAPMLPWVPSRDWHSPDPSYDVADLTAETLKLLSSDAPVLTRMENMRRAAIYADQDPAIAGALLGAVLARTNAIPADPRAAALAWFDAGYLVETYRQLDLIYKHEMRRDNGRAASMVPVEVADLDGYVLVQKALALTPAAKAEIEFAASLMTQQGLAATHRRQATAGAAPDSALARNLAAFATE